MAFSDFTLRSALEAFGLAEERGLDLFAGTPPIVPSAFLQVWLDDFAPVALNNRSDAARSHLIIAALLDPAHRRASGAGNLMAGLNGFCDFMITRSPELFFLRAPLVAVVEAKKEDIIAGLGQCAASMVALREFNERDGTPVPAVFGMVTSGNVWRFLRLSGTTLVIDRRECHSGDAATLLGLLVRIANGG